MSVGIVVASSAINLVKLGAELGVEAKWGKKGEGGHVENAGGRQQRDDRDRSSMGKE